MPHVADDGSPLLERLIYGADGTTYLPLAVDADGNLVCAILAGQTIEVTQDNAALLMATVNVAADQNINARAYGLWGANQKPAGLPFGASAALVATASNTSLPSGTSLLTIVTVPANTVYVLTHISMQYTGTPPTNIRARLTVGGTTVIIFQQASPVTLVMYDRQGWWVLGPGDELSLGVSGATLNDDLVGYVAGFSYSVA